MKEVALGVLASLVMQKLFAGASFTDPSVGLGILVSFTLYLCAFHFYMVFESWEQLMDCMSRGLDLQPQVDTG